MAIIVPVLRIILALLFAAAAVAKLLGVPMMVAEFDTVGLGQWFRYATAAIELIGAVLLVLPRRSFYGAALLICVCVGAAFAQLMRIHQDVIHCVVLALLLAFVAWRSRPAVV